MTARAKLVVTTGPDRGKMFDMTDELIHVGRGSENQIVLSDPALSEHQMSIVSRNGRYAIYTPTAEGIEVEGNVIPPQKWVWLPDEATIQITARTAVKFVYMDGTPEGNGSGEKEKKSSRGGGSPSQSTTATVSVPDGSSQTVPKVKRTPSAKATKKTTVARFITDGPGDPLVKLGEDGHLPELNLTEGEHRRKRQAEKSQSNPLLLVGAIAFSFLMSLLMLFVDFGSVGTNTTSKAEARHEITEYFGGEKDQPKQYQLLLRQAQQAYSRHDYDMERREYRKVLELLRAEGKNKFSGLTGSIDHDERLEELIAVLLSD